MNRPLATGIGAAAIVLGAIAAAPSSYADAPQPGCSDRERMVNHLSATYGEKLRGAGLQSATGLMELYVSEEGSWTLLLTRPDGTSCPVAVGEQWRHDLADEDDVPA